MNIAGIDVDLPAGYTEEEFLAYLKEPDFHLARKVHDWRNHVPMRFIVPWSFLGLQTRVSIYITAEATASEESWD